MHLGGGNFIWSLELLQYLCAVINIADILRKVLLRKNHLFIVLFLLSAEATKAQAYSDTLSVTIYYPCGSSNIAQYPNNLHSLGRFIHQLDSVGQLYVITPISLSLTASTSPDGGINVNRLIAHRRGLSALDYLNNHSESFRTITSSTPCHVEELTTNHLRSKTQWANYPTLRFAKVYLHIQGETKDTLVAEAQPDTCITTNDDNLEEETPVVAVQPEAEPQLDAKPSMVTTSRPVLFVKTNLLYDLATFVNVSVEVPLSRRLTAEATLVYPWWRSTAKHKTVQMRYVAITPRYYFKNTDKPYTSFFAGLTAGSGTYDLQWTRRGVQGTLWHVSPTFGYSHYISKRWKMEYSASVGYVQTHYHKYTQTADTPYGEIKVHDYPWVSHVLRTVLPTSLNVSLVYSFNKLKKVLHHEP